MESLDKYLDIANSISCDDADECDIAFGNKINSPISEGLRDFSKAASDLYKVGHKSLNENAFMRNVNPEYQDLGIKGSPKLIADLSGLSEDELYALRNMSRDEILEKYGKPLSALHDNGGDIETIEVSDGKLSISMPNISSTGMSAAEFAKKMGEHTKAEEEAYRKANLKKRMSESPKPKEFSLYDTKTDFTKDALPKDVAIEVAEVVRSMALDGVQKTIDDMDMNDPIKGNYWDNQIANYADVIASDKNRDAVVKALQKEMSLTRNNFNTLVQLYGPEGD